MNAMETRKLAQSLGFKNVAKFGKVELEAMIAAKQAEIEAAKAPKVAKSAPVRKQSKRCEVCSTRPASKTSPEGRLCVECLEEAEWENTHSDNDHVEGYAVDGLGTATADCWVCHPELNEAAKTYVAPRGSSRLGMVLHVAPRSGGQEKAKQVQGQLPKGFETEIRADKGTVYLVASNGTVFLTLAWDVQGRYAYDATEIKTGSKSRKARNVSAALKAAKA